MAAPAQVQGDASVSQLIRSLLLLAWVTVLAGLANAFVSPYLFLFLSRKLHADPVQAAVFLILTPQSAIVIGTMLAGCPIAAGCGIGCSSLGRLPGASYLRCLL